jgi:hypothetical protein
MDLEKSSEPKAKLGDTIFAIVHLLLIVALVVFAFVDLFQGNVVRFAVLMTGLVLYYFLVLHKGVLKEIRRKRSAGTSSRAKNAKR